ncbi:signal recognition particle, SRP9/SRP14 subunit [Morchella conica CCBAS932]|uniref:Signal recognition particle subunit SRP14 n=1 Tax=Morchella conica CCBAS932 TaxID=1392247 RepID=A0A3N4KWI3_9PEZI|nr:signal recognition particle, SRP9/SRP14 subunit [Morchella conica CCBAS932]
MASQGRLSNDEFFAQLTSLLTSTSASEKNSVYITQKVLIPFSEDSKTPVAPIDPDAPLQLLIRATDGQEKAKKVKFSTVVEAGQLEAFYVRYAEVAKSGMTTLKKRDRKARKLRARKKGKAVEGTTAPTALAV